MKERERKKEKEKKRSFVVQEKKKCHFVGT